MENSERQKVGERLPGAVESRNRSYYLMGTEFVWVMMNKFWKYIVVMVVHILIVLNATKLYILSGKFYVVYILPQYRKVF